MYDIRAIVTELLRIAKVAMPGKLFAEDPRVLRAHAWLERHDAESAGGEEVIRRLDEAAERNLPDVIPGRVPDAGCR